MKKLFSYSVLMLVFMALTTSCEHKPLELLDDNDRNVHLVYDWKNLMPGDEKPEGMKLVFGGPTHNKTLEVGPVYDINTQLKPDKYTIVTWPTDVPSITATPKDDDVIISCVDNSVPVPNIYVATQKETVGLLPEDETQNIIITPERFNCLYTVRVLGTELYPSAHIWNGTLSGLTDKVYAISGNCAPGATPQTVTFDLISQPGNIRSTVISTLGDYPEKENVLWVKIGLPNDDLYCYKLDVSDQIRNAPDKRNVTIEMDLRKLKPVDPEDVKGAFNQKVDDFGNHDNEILM